MRTVLVIAALFCPGLWAGTLPLSASVPTVLLRNEAVSTGESVLLGDVAELQGVPTELLSRAKDLSIGKAPQPGQRRTYSQHDVLLALRRTQDFEKWDVRGLSVSVRAACETIAGRLLAEAATASVKQHFEKDPDLVVEVELAAVPADVQVRSAVVTLAVEQTGASLRPGSQTLRVRILQDGKCVAEAPVNLRLRVTGRLPVAARPISADEIIAAGDVTELRRELSASELSNRVDARKLIGMRAKRAVAAGDVLLKNNFAMPQVIKRGDLVTLYLKCGALELATRGEAKADALLDESVRVLVLDSNAEVLARASGVGEATIEDKGRRNQ